MEQIPKNRLEAFSDGVIAILITIMVLELHPPEKADLASLRPLLPTLLSYILSFMYLAIYWNNHHHMLHAAQHVNGRIMWANMHLLFWLSLFPFSTAWIGKAHGDAWPTAVYGFVFLMAALSYAILQRLIIQTEGPDSVVARALRNKFKETVSPVCYLLAIIFAFVAPWVSIVFYVLVALLWIVPDQRIERIAEAEDEKVEELLAEVEEETKKDG